MIVNRLTAVFCLLLVMLATALSHAIDPPTTAALRSLQLRLIRENAPPEVPADDLPDPSDPTGRARLHVLREVIADGADVSNIHLETNQGANDLTVIIEMKPAGADRLGAATEANAGHRLAVVMDGQVVVAPMIMGRISDRVAISQANPNEQQLTRLATRLSDAVAQRVELNIPTTVPSTRPATQPVRP